MTAARSLSALLAGCSCYSCRARDAFRCGRWTVTLPSMSPELQWLLYGCAVTERTVTVH